MTIRLAIHHRPESFSDRWIKYCSEQGINYLTLNCFDFNIISQIQQCDGLLWHWDQEDPKAQLMARQLISSFEKNGVKVFPNIATCWHFDDKIGQKYLLEVVGAPLVPTYIFYDKDEAMAWIKNAEFPKIFKLRNGAGSLNVKLINTKREAEKYCSKAFGRGFSTVNQYFADSGTKVRKIRSLEDMIGKVMRLPKSVYRIYMINKYLQRQVGYIYFQDFLPNNNFDTRITIIGDRAFGFTRNNRPNDFRASGSGNISYDLNSVDKRCITIAFAVAKKLNTQSLAFDFLFDQNKTPHIVEISYGFKSSVVYNCLGYWDDNLNFHDGHMFPEDAILTDFLNYIYAEKSNPLMK